MKDNYGCNQENTETSPSVPKAEDADKGKISYGKFPATPDDQYSDNYRPGSGKHSGEPLPDRNVIGD